MARLYGTPDAGIRIFNATRNSDQFSIQVLTRPGKIYVLESREALHGSEGWSQVRELFGDGTVWKLTDNSTGKPQKFYRLRMK